SGTSGSWRQHDELSITTAPWAAILGDHSLDTSEPADIRQMSVAEKSYCSSAFTLRILSPYETSTPMLLRDARATTSSAGNVRSARMLSISRPTLPVAPTTATLKPMAELRERTVLPHMGMPGAARF